MINVLAPGKDPLEKARRARSPFRRRLSTDAHNTVRIIHVLYILHNPTLRPIMLILKIPNEST